MKIFTWLTFAIGSLLSLQAQAVDSNSATIEVPTTSPSASSIASPTSLAPVTQPETNQTTDAQISDQDLQQSLKEANAWLQLVDQEKYADSWNNASTTLKLVMSEKEWTKYLEKMRKPLGKMTEREMLQQRTFINPPGAPQGEYVVIFYQTAFNARPQANEQIIMIKESDDKWRPMSYFFR